MINHAFFYHDEPEGLTSGRALVKFGHFLELGAHFFDLLFKCGHALFILCFADKSVFQESLASLL